MPVPKSSCGNDVRRLSLYLDALEAREGVEPGSVRILPIVTETPGSMFGLGSYAMPVAGAVRGGGAARMRRN